MYASEIPNKSIPFEVRSQSMANSSCGTTASPPSRPPTMSPTAQQNKLETFQQALPIRIGPPRLAGGTKGQLGRVRPTPNLNQYEKP